MWTNAERRAAAPSVVDGAAGRGQVRTCARRGFGPHLPGRRGGGAGGPRAGAVVCRGVRGGPVATAAADPVTGTACDGARARPGSRARSGAGTERARLAAQVDVAPNREPGDEVHGNQ